MTDKNTASADFVLWTWMERARAMASAWQKDWDEIRVDADGKVYVYCGGAATAVVGGKWRPTGSRKLLEIEPPPAGTGYKWFSFAVYPSNWSNAAAKPPKEAVSSWVTSANCGGIFNVNDVLYMFADASLEDGEYFPAITAVLKHNNQCVYYWTDDEGFDNRDDAVRIARENMVKVWEDFTSRLSGGGCE